MKNNKQRRKCRIPVIAYCPVRNIHWQGHTRTLSHHGIYLSRSYSFPVDSDLAVKITYDDVELTLHGTVSRIGLRGSEIKFKSLSPEQKSALDQLMNPEWKSGNLLDCLLIAARHNSMRTLTDCFKLTSLIEKNRKHTSN